MGYTLVIAGLNPISFDRLKKESGKLLAPDGQLIAIPNHFVGAYARGHADDLIAQVHKVAVGLQESEPFKTLLLYTDFGDDTTSKLLESFFPFSLPLRISSIIQHPQMSKRLLNESLNSLIHQIVTGSKKLRDVSRIISGFTEVNNLTPLLLPTGNFRSPELMVMLNSLYRHLATSADPKAFIDAAVKDFFRGCPRAKAPDQVRHCFSDGQLFFQSPGKHRHGFFRHRKDDGHNPRCLLAARSRIGGVFDYRLHYDCTPTKGGLKTSYDNCHGSPTPPNARHVNIAPNDFVI